MNAGANEAWYIARATGLVAWSLLATSALWGVLLATRALGRRPTAPWLLDMHQYMGSVSLGFTVVHVLAMIADSYVHFDLGDVLIPFASQWRSGPVAWGVVALYLIVAVEATSFMRRRLSMRLWHRFHLLSYPALAVATVHLLSAGTDARRLLTTGVAVMIGVVTAIVSVGGLIRSVRATQRRQSPRIIP